MSLSIAIIGLPNVGKSTLFNSLLKRQAALAANYPFATIEPNIGVVDVPDVRLVQLAEIIKKEFAGKTGDREVPERIMPSVIKFYDVAGLVKGASKGEGLGNQFLSHIKETDAILHMVRDFEDENILRAGSTNPKDDIEVIETELILADLEVLNKRITQHETILKKQKNDENLKKQELYIRLKAALDQGTLASKLGFDEKELLLIKDLNLLTLKPKIIVRNVSESDMVNKGTQSDNELCICARAEFEILSLPAEERQLFMQELGMAEPGLNRIIRKSFELLDLQSYFTAGPKEVRAWTIKKGTKAPQAAGVIHTDFERGFISAEVIGVEDLVKCGGWKQAKERGLIRIEGKNYVFSDGDVTEFRFSV